MKCARQITVAANIGPKADDFLLRIQRAATGAPWYLDSPPVVYVAKIYLPRVSKYLFMPECEGCDRICKKKVHSQLHIALNENVKWFSVTRCSKVDP